jgi:putative DNA primase/helicase
LLPELEAIKWFGREVFITFDSDAASNPNVIAAEARLVDELMRKRGAKVTIVRLPPSDQGKEALDTFLQKFQVAGLLELIKNRTAGDA